MEDLSPIPGGQADVELVDVDDVRQWVTRLVWPQRGYTDRIGVEVEAFPIVITPAGYVGGRLTIDGSGGVLEVIDGAGAPDGPVGSRDDVSVSVPTRPGGRITFEPGGQVEYSSAPHEGIDGLMSDVDVVWDCLETAFAHRDVGLVPLGIDPWHDPDQVAQQLDAHRYRAMERFFGDTWPAGAVMMRNSAALQLNLDLGDTSVRGERWLAANLIAPYLAAMFNSSPGRDGTTNLRSKTWRGIDSSRTGLPLWGSVDDADAIDDVLAQALRANVMLVLRGERCHEPGPGWSFGDWLGRPPPHLGRPRVSDLVTHLSTLFPEVRPRNGTLELRSIDALPRRWWAVPVVVGAALLYDDRAREQVIDLLSPDAARLADLLRSGVTKGLADPDLGSGAHKLARLALDTACGDDRFTASSVQTAEAFCERFTMRCRAPADEIRPLLDDPPGLLRWVLGPEI